MKITFSTESIGLDHWITYVRMGDRILATGSGNSPERSLAESLKALLEELK